MKQKAIKVLKQFQEKLDSFDESTFDTVNVEVLQQMLDTFILMAEEEMEQEKEKKVK
jgi:hypothetical protein